ncbi:MAG: glycosyltransferase family 39 protein, partial [Chloroflexi bacterium]|nr:glycosyltransferase family 39 protein [Chloroflexota bacterium]
MDKPQTSPARSLIFKDRLRLFLLVAYVLLGVIYSFATPMLEKNDEESHAWFVHHLVMGGGLPIQVPGTPDSPIQREGSQPPLYYAAAALVMRAFDTSDFDTQLQPNAAPTFNPYSPGNKNLLIITPEKRAFNYRNTTLAVFVLRLLGILPGCLTVWFTYAVAYAVVPDRRVALLAMALTAFNPMFITVTTALGNDGLVIALSTVAIYLLLVLALEGITVRRLVITGIVLALASLSKVSGTLLLPISALAIIGRELLAPPDGNRPWARRAGTIMWQGGVLLVLWLAIAGWWYARNLYLYNDLTGTSVMAQMMTPRNISIAEALAEFNGFKMSYIAMFGQFAVPADDIVYIGFDAIVVASGLGMIFGAIRSTAAARRRREPAPNMEHLRWLAGGMLVLHIVLLLASILRWTLMTPASHGRLLFPAIAGISTLMALGLLQLAGLLARRPRAVAAAGAAIALVVTLPLGVVAAVAPFRYIIPAYTPPLLAAMPAGVTPVAQRFRSLAEIVAYQMTPQEVRPGDRVRVTAILRALGATPDNYLLVVKLY